MMRYVYLLAVMLMLGGCIKNVTNKPAFRDFVNKTIQTRTDSAIVMRDGWRIGFASWFSDPAPMPSLVARSELWASEQPIALVPAGTEAKIHRIHLVAGDSVWYQAEVELLTETPAVEGIILLRWYADPPEPVFGLPMPILDSRQHEAIR